MTDFVKDKEGFIKYKSRFYQLFDPTVDFEDNPFNHSFKYFLAFEFDFIYHELFFEGLKEFLSKIGDKTVTFYTIDPPPEEYFYKHFQKYSVFEISNDATDKELNHIMMKNPGDNSADAIALTSDEISWHSSSNDWGIMGSKDWEVAIVGFTSENIKELFIKSFSDNAQPMFTSVNQFVEEFKEIVVLNDVRTNFYNNLIKNYQDRV